MAVLLIGSTGNGKSTLGNFLLNPNDPHTNQTFRTAQDNKPQTQSVKQSTKKIAVQDHGNVDLMVIDTPGLNESAKRDLRHMTAIIKFLVKNSVPVRACIVVVKFSSKIDAQYKATVQYYSKLLPRLFEKNVIIVMTAYETDPRSAVMRKRQGIDVEAIKNNTTEEIVECAGMYYEPILFTVDCLPFDEEEKSFNFKVRDAMLQYIFQLEPITLASMQVAKTADIQREDREKISKYNGQVKGYNLRLQEADAASKEALEELEFKEADITEKVGKIARLESDLDGKDSSDTVVTKSWSLNEEWRFLRRLTKPFNVSSKWEIEKVNKWNNGRCEWKECVEEEYSVRGTLEGQFMRGIYASITLETQKRIRFAHEIKQLRDEIAEEKRALIKLKTERQRIDTRHSDHVQQLKLLKKFIAERRADIEVLSKQYLSIEEADKRFQ